jgi:hypothetical protein
MPDSPHQPTPQQTRKPDPRPRRFMGIELTWKVTWSSPSDLPKEADRYIHKAVFAGGLNTNAILELRDHFRAAMADGRSVPDIIKALGNPKDLGSKLGRASSPFRWFYARVMIWLGRILLILLLIDLAMWGCLRWAQPHPTIDYYAQISEQTLRTPAESHAWPLYRQALMDGRMHSPVINEILVSQPYTVCDHPVQPGDPNWPAAKTHLTNIQPLLALLRQGAQKPNLGCTFLPLHKLPEEDQRALADDPSAPLPPTPLSSNDTISRLLADQFDEDALKQFLTIRIAMETLLVDMNLAAEQSDAPRLLANFQTLLSASRQINQTPLFVARNQAQMLSSAAIRRIAQLALDYPGLFTDAALGDIRRTIAQESAYWDTLGAPKNLLMLDRLQRSYTSNGPDGRVTFTGLAYLWDALNPKQDSFTKNHTLIAPLCREFYFPAHYLLFPSAKTLLDEQAKMDTRYYVQSATPWTRSSQLIPILETHGTLSTLIRITHEYPRFLVRLDNWQLAGTLLAMAKAQVKQDDALLAVAQYHARHGRYTESFQALVPEFLPTTPNAAIGDPLLIKITPHGPIIYSAGLNAIDEGGLYVPADRNRPDKNTTPPPGDDIHYPVNANRIQYENHTRP